MARHTYRLLEYSTLLIALMLIVATSPGERFGPPLGQSIALPEDNLTTDDAGVVIGAVVRLANGLDVEELSPCSSAFSVNLANASDTATQVHFWELVEPWNGTFPPNVTNNDSAADDDDSAADDDDSAADDDDSAADDDASSGQDAASELSIVFVEANETVNTAVGFEVACEDVPLRVLVFAQSEGEIDIDISGELRVITSQTGPPVDGGGPISCDLPPEGAPDPAGCGADDADEIDTTLDGMSIEFLPDNLLEAP